MEWKSVKISDVATIINGGTPKTSVPEYWDGDIPWLSVKDFNNGLKYVESAEKSITNLGLENSATNLLHRDDVIISARGTVGVVSMIGRDMAFNQSCFGLRAKDFDAHFLYYLLKESVRKLQNQSQGSVFDTIVRATFDRITCNVPVSISDQRRISTILSSLDAQIENNNRINHNLEEQAQALFKSWFVDFEPWGGVMPEDWKEYELGEFMPIKTGKKDANIASKKGLYPFFSCSQDILWTNNYSFDGSAILVAGNGDFNVKWYEGKFEAYQRTYVLMPYNQRYTHFLFYAIKHFLADITCGARGSVIKFITKGNLENFRLKAPANLEECDIIDKFMIMNKSIANTQQQSARLATLRDTLLPKLMKGEIEL